MANDTFDGIARKVLLRADVPLTLAYDWVRSSFRDIVERRRWSWLLKRGQLVVYDEYTTGTATSTADSSTITINTGVVSSTFVGRQFRFGSSLPIATITAVDVGLNTLTVDQATWPSTQTAQPYSIYQAYVALPSDFHSFVSVIDPNNARPLPFSSNVTKFDKADPQRVAAGLAQALGWLDYYSASAATIKTPRYELWPHQRSAAVFPFIYESRPTDPFDTNAQLPALLPSDVVLERALMYCGMWPGTESKPNPYFGGNKLGLANMHKAEFERRIAILEKQDNEHMQQNIWYQSDQESGGTISGSWMQSHDLAT